MMKLSMITLILILLFKTVHCHYWSFIKFNNPVNLTIINTFHCDSVILCASRCYSMSPLIEMATIQDGQCYCLNPLPILSGFEEQINLSSVYSRTPEVCIINGYQSLPDLGICIKYSTFKANWTDAQTYCKQDGGYLINLNTAEKLTRITNMTKDNPAFPGGLLHVGGFKDNVSADIKWTRGGSFDSLMWSLNEPNGGSSEKCLALNQGRNGIYDLPCAMNTHFICEILF